jgi:pimeloyl-ACP methyl ester carboxylesterase
MSAAPPADNRKESHRPRSNTVTTWLNAPFRTQFKVIDGLTVRFAQSKPTQSKCQGQECALLLSPWPESLLAFEPVWSPLAEHARLVAIDLPGFGRSQHRDAVLSPRAMSEFIIAAADAFGLEHPHLVAPGTGTPAALFAAARYPGRLCSLVVGSGAAAVPLLGSPLRDWIEAPDLEAIRRADPQVLIGGPLASLKRFETPEPVLEDYLASYQGNRLAGSMRYLRAYPADLPVLAHLLPRIRTPVRIIAGAYDTTVPLANAEFMAERLSDSRLDILEAGHFTWEEAADEYAALVTSWWSETTGVPADIADNPTSCKRSSTA